MNEGVRRDQMQTDVEAAWAELATATAQTADSMKRLADVSEKTARRAARFATASVGPQQTSTN
jgi:hypothetical protein